MDHHSSLLTQSTAAVSPVCKLLIWVMQTYIRQTPPCDPRKPEAHSQEALSRVCPGSLRIGASGACEVVRARWVKLLALGGGTEDSHRPAGGWKE